MSLLRRIALRMLLCLAVAAGPFGHAAMAAPAPIDVSLGHAHCDHDAAADRAGTHRAADDHAKTAKSGGCLTICCALAAIVFDAISPGDAPRAHRPFWRLTGLSGGALKPPLPPPRD